MFLVNHLQVQLVKTVLLANKPIKKDNTLHYYEQIGATYNVSSEIVSIVITKMVTVLGLPGFQPQ